MTPSYLTILLIIAALFTCDTQAGNNIGKVDTRMVHRVSDIKQFNRIFNKLPKLKGNLIIELENGVYSVDRRLWIRHPNLTIRSVSNKPEDVVIESIGMKKTGAVKNLFDVAAPNFQLIGVTLRNAPNHLIQVHGKQNADDFLLDNCRLQDSYEQMLKVSHGKGPNAHSADRGIVRNSLFEYTAGIGPQYYVAGIDAHNAHDWIVEGNEFRNIASPSERISEFAIHFWNGSSNMIVRNNKIKDSDRGIGFGMKRHKLTVGGQIVNNVIVHSNKTHKFADVGISLQKSPGTLVAGNTVLFEHDYPNAIEYRFKQTSDVIIRDNTVNRKIASRNGGQAKLVNNAVID